MKKLLPFLAVALGGCAGSDGYKLKRPEFVRASISVRFVDHEDRASLMQAARAMGADAGRHRVLEAFSEIRADECVIHMIDLRRIYRPAWLGHEIAHCRYGRFHD